MEVKFIIYIIGGILYFFYKRAQDIKKNAAPPSAENTQPVVEQPKPIRPPAYNPLDEARRELQRKAAAVEAQRKLSVPERQPLLTAQRADTQKDLFIREKKKATFGEGANDAPIYEEELPASARLQRADIRLENEGIYKIETMEEARAAADNDARDEYEFDAKQAFIGSVIFERKY